MSFEVVWEVDPPADADRAGLERLERQFDAVGGLADAVLVPDNPTGRAAVSSLEVARRALAHGLRPIACLNARDRNRLGLRRDLLTARVLGIDEVLLIAGDAAEDHPAGALTVSGMLQECRSEVGGGIGVGVATGLRPLAPWKRAADRLFVQVTWSLDALLRWREGLDFDGPVHPAVLVVPSVAMARRLAERVPELAVPEPWLDAIARDPDAGFDLAAGLVEGIRVSGAFEGVHVIGGARFRTAADAIRRRLVPALIPST